MNESIKKSLNKLSDDELLYILSIRFGQNIPIWKKCSKKEYEKHNYSEDKLTLEGLIKFLEEIFSTSNVYKKVPYWNNGGGILDQISDREPNGYAYYKSASSKFVLMLGSDMINYLDNRKPSWWNKFRK